MGIAEGCALAIANSLLASTPNPEKEYSKASMGSVALGATFIAIAPLIQRRYSVTGLFAASAVICLLLTWATTALPRGSTRQTMRTSTASGSRIAIALLLFSVLLWGTSTATIWAFLVEIGRRTTLNEEELGLMIGFSSFGSVLGSGLATALNVRFGSIRPIFLGMVINAGTIFVLTYNTHSAIFIAAATGQLACVYFLLPYLLGAAASIDPGGRCSAAVAGVFVLSGGLGPIVGGILIHATGGYAALGWLMVTAAAIAFVIVAYVVRSASMSPLTHRKAQASA